MAPHRVVELAGAGGGAPLANLCLPVVDRGEVVAILNVDAFQDRHAFGDDAFQAIAAFQPLVAFVLRDAELRRRLSVTATTDALTGLPNRRAFDEQVAHAIAAAQRYGTSLALLIMDMVGFKAVNDKYGHRVGDRVLQEVAAALSAVPRGGDVVYRWGGDEFAALLRNVDDEEAQRVARRFAEVVEQVRTVDGPLRISVGCALYPEDAESLGQLLETADARMYQSKEAARGVDPA
ncbi:MAG: GGDEF domain-containing protein, partial [Trueperaceae bacterium]